MPEPSDRHVYNYLSFYGDTIKFFLAAIKFYEGLLEADVEALQSDREINVILDEKVFESLPLYRELRTVRSDRQWLEQRIKQSQDDWDYDLSLSHGTIRFLKGVAQLYLQHLKQRRNAIASRPNVSRSALVALDTRISELEEKTTMGVFADATPKPLLIEQVIPQEHLPATQQPSGLAGVSRPRPVVISSIGVLDSELRSRCMDLYDAFCADGTTDRLDTVLAEATRILENRIRAAAGLPSDCLGLDLAGKAFGGDTPILRISNLPNEQAGAHQLYRGVFGFVRNHVQHQLVAGLLPERVLQVLGMIDYLLFLVDGATRTGPTSTGD